MKEETKRGSLLFWSRIISTLEKLPEVYDAANFIMSMGSLNYVRKVFGDIVAKNFRGKGSIIVDAGCGPGSSIDILLKSTGKSTFVVGLDPIESMLSKSQAKFERDSRVELVRGIFEALPFRDNSLAGVTYSFSFRDAINYYKATSELYRSLNKGGIVVILDLGKPRRRRIYSKILEGPYMILLPALAGAILMGWKGVKRYLDLRMTYIRFPETPKLCLLFFKLFNKVKCSYMLGGATFILEAKK